MKRYLFLLAWCEGSDSAGGDLTGINTADDLYPQFVAGNNHILAVDIIAPNDEIATAFGFWTAFRNNYTALDSCSDVIELDPSIVLNNVVKLAIGRHYNWSGVIQFDNK